jgi:motility quorum-sensing regulator / GCU-specific mRNA interferase toxin
MEKRKPHYDLPKVQSGIRLRGADAFTATALIGAQAMGLDVAEAIEVVCSMSRMDFYKSMTTYASSEIWQDVYHPETAGGIAYVKVTLRQDGAIVIQFKEK